MRPSASKGMRSYSPYPIDCTAAPSTWPSAICGLTTCPQSTASTTFNTRTRPVSVSTSTSANTAANGGGESYDMCDACAMIWNWSRW